MRTMKTPHILFAFLTLLGACADKPEICPEKHEKSKKYGACAGGNSCEGSLGCWNGFCGEICDPLIEGTCAGAREICIIPYISTPVGICLESCVGTMASEYLDNDYASCSIAVSPEGEASGYWAYDYAGICGG